MRGAVFSSFQNVIFFSAEGPNTIHGPEETRVIISSLRSHVLKIRVTKKPGQMNADLLSDDSDVQTGIWDSITRSVYTKKKLTD